MKKKNKKITIIAIVTILAVIAIFKLDIHVLNSINSLSRFEWDVHVGESYCEFRGGEMLVESLTIDYETWVPRSKCYFQYSDSGKECFSSDECKGECILQKPKLNVVETDSLDYVPSGTICEQIPNNITSFTCEYEELVGTCQNFPHNGCDGKAYWELKNDNIISLGWGYCMPPV